MQHGSFFSDFYETGAMMLEEEAAIISGLLVGLNVIDCNIGIKDEDLDRPVRVLCVLSTILLKSTTVSI